MPSRSICAQALLQAVAAAGLTAAAVAAQASAPAAPPAGVAQPVQLVQLAQVAPAQAPARLAGAQGTASPDAAAPAAVTPAGAVSAPAASAAARSTAVGTTAASPSPSAAAATLPAEQTGALAAGRMQSANIFDVPSANDAAAQVARQRAQPLNNAPVWRQVNSGKAFYTSLPGRETGVLIQHGGEPWRRLRNDTVTFWGGWAVVLAILGLAGYHAWHGMQCLKEPRTGRLIERFTVLERAAHRTMSLSFVVLAASGALMLFGKYVLLPVFGYSLFSTLGALSKNLHNFVGPLFGVSLVVSFFVFVRDNLPRRQDWQWIRQAGGLLGKSSHIPSGKFNAGEKMWFWVGVFLLGTAVTASGLVLDFPNFEQTRAQMQLAWTVHAVAALMFLCASFGHIYMGTLGVEGVREGMRTGYVDDAWAREHHELWYRDVVDGRLPRVRSRHPDVPAVAPDGRPIAT